MSIIDIRELDISSIRFADDQIIDDVQSNAIAIEDETTGDYISIKFEDVVSLILALQKVQELRE